MPASSDAFTIVGAEYRQRLSPTAQKSNCTACLNGKPVSALVALCLIISGCILFPLFLPHDPGELFLMNINEAPGSRFWFGTDSLGRDIFSIIWHGGRSSLFIGLCSAVISTFIGVTYGCISGYSSEITDTIMMRTAELMQSIPVLLSLLLLLSLTDDRNEFTLSCAIGITGWFALARLVRSEVRQIRTSEYILASRCMGAGFFFIMRKHLIPNLVSAIMFVVISGISTSMIMEATLSFLGLGLPVDVVSWGSMLALADKALLMNAWWVILIPGIFLVVTLLSLTQIGHFFRNRTNQGPSKL